jgi:hypothetical protein
MDSIAKKRSQAMLATVLTASLLAAASVVAGCGGEDVTRDITINTQATAAATDASAATVVPVPSSSVSVEDQLIFLREEEKLARDVYLALYDKWGAVEFRNIGNSESRHMESVKNLLDRYGLDDPVAGDDAGVFANHELQAAYDSLVAQGSESLEAAYQVGVTIERLDIEDLQTPLVSTTQADIVRVAQNLLNGSQNHLAEFSSLLGQ